MRFDWNADELAFRDEVRAFLDAELTPEMRAVSRRMTSVYAPHELSMAWQAILHARGWAAPAWPVEHGGGGWGPAPGLPGRAGRVGRDLGPALHLRQRPAPPRPPAAIAHGDRHVRPGADRARH